MWLNIVLSRPSEYSHLGPRNSRSKEYISCYYNSFGRRVICEGRRSACLPRPSSVGRRVNDKLAGVGGKKTPYTRERQRDCRHHHIIIIWTETDIVYAETRRDMRARARTDGEWERKSENINRLMRWRRRRRIRREQGPGEPPL